MPAAPTPENDVGARVVVGAVSELYQGDLDLGRRAADQLAGEQLGTRVVVEDLHYGAVAVAQRLEELRPDVLILVGAVARGRPPGQVERRTVTGEHVSSDPAAQAAVADAVTGYVGVDLILEVAAALGALPARTVVIEVEPASTAPSDQLTPAGQAGLEQALELVRTEVATATSGA